MITEFPLFVFTTLGGLAAGASVAAAVFGHKGHAKRAWLFPLVCLALLGAGLLGVLGHLQRPELFWLALSNPSAMIAQEAYWSIALCVFLAADIVVAFVRKTSLLVLRVGAALASAGLMFVMANAYFTSKTNAAWADLSTFPLFIIGDLAMGFALYAAFHAARRTEAPYAGASMAIDGLLVVSLVVAGVNFGAAGHDAFAFYAGAVLAAAAAAVDFLAWKGKLKTATASWAALALAVVAVAVARYAFYAISVL
ncbi:DmsC/YnfH family molybdoenzyme membrane anchor subunit [Rubneribacter sp.]